MLVSGSSPELHKWRVAGKDIASSTYSLATSMILYNKKFNEKFTH